MLAYLKNNKLTIIALLLLLLIGVIYIYLVQQSEIIGSYKAEVLEKNVKGQFSNSGPRFYCRLRLESGEKVRVTPCGARPGDIVTVAKLKQYNNKNIYIIQSVNKK